MESFGRNFDSSDRDVIKTKELLFFGNFLLDSRIRFNNKSMGQIARDLGVASSTIVKRWESGEAFPKVERLADVAKAYGVSLEELTRALEVSQKARETELGFKYPKPKKKKKL